MANGDMAKWGNGSQIGIERCYTLIGVPIVA